MKVKIKSNQKLNYETQGACGFDFKSNNAYTVNPGEIVLIDTGTVIEVPEGYVLNVYPRSSTYKKLGLIMVNSVGIIDNDYCGNDDTIKLMYLNMSKNTQTINTGDRIGQGVITPVVKAEFEYIKEMKFKNRGGYGTTGI